MNIASIFDWFAQDSAYAAEHTDEPRQRGMWLQLAEQWEAAALQASSGVEARRVDATSCVYISYNAPR